MRIVNSYLKMSFLYLVLSHDISNTYTSKCVLNFHIIQICKYLKKIGTALEIKLLIEF